MWYSNNAWHLQQLIQGPSTLPGEYVVSAPGTAAAGNVFATVYNGQQHYPYRDSQNNVQDVWYDTAGWHAQQITRGP